MIKLPDTVVVTGAGGEQPQTVRQSTQPLASLGIMILMVDFDAIQPMITRQCLQHPRGEYVLAAAPPRMGDHCQAACLVHQVDATFHLDGVTVHMRWTTIGQEAIECLLAIANMTCLDPVSYTHLTLPTNREV